MQSVKKAIIPAAGLGTRLLTATKELPKEMLFVFSSGVDGGVSVKPVVQLIFEQLFDWGIREFCFVVGRGKRAVEDHFTPDSGFISMLEKRGKKTQARELRKFYDRVSGSSIVWVNQAEPKGFGDAVLCPKSFADDTPIIVQAGDSHVISPRNDHLRRMLHAKQHGHANATLMLRHVDDPRQYGVAEVVRKRGEILVKKVVEKPDKPKSKLALLPTYLFGPVVFDILRTTKPGRGGEIQLTDGIQAIIDRGLKTNAIQLHPTDLWLDVGTPETYWQALKTSHGISTG